MDQFRPILERHRDQWFKMILLLIGIGAILSALFITLHYTHKGRKVIARSVQSAVDTRDTCDSQTEIYDVVAAKCIPKTCFPELNQKKLHSLGNPEAAFLIRSAQNGQCLQIDSAPSSYRTYAFVADLRDGRPTRFWDVVYRPCDYTNSAQHWAASATSSGDVTYIKNLALNGGYLSNYVGSASGSAPLLVREYPDVGWESGSGTDGGVLSAQAQLVRFSKSAQRMFTFGSVSGGLLDVGSETTQPTWRLGTDGTTRDGMVAMPVSSGLVCE